MIKVIRVAKIFRTDGTPDVCRCLVIGDDGQVLDRLIDEAPSSMLGSEIKFIDESSCSLMPLLADSHIHLGVSNGLVELDKFHSLEIVEHQLAKYMAAGIGHVLSLGTDQPWVQDLSQEYLIKKPSGRAFPYSAGCGFGAAAGWPPELTKPQLRYRPTDPATARQDVRHLQRQGLSTLKIWVDDLNGTVPKMPIAISKVIVDEAHRYHLQRSSLGFERVWSSERLQHNCGNSNGAAIGNHNGRLLHTGELANQCC